MELSQEIINLANQIPKMETLSEFRVGSYPFFKDYPDYICHDIDKLRFVDKIDIKYDDLCANRKYLVIRENEEDIFIYEKMTKEQYLNYIFCDMRMNNDNDLQYIYEDFSLLCPDFIQYFNITIDDIRPLENNFKHKNDKHKYQKVIFDSYIENNGMYLTQEQLNKAYEEYKKYRPEIYKKGI